MATTVTSGISEKTEMMSETAYGDGGVGGAEEFGFIKKISWTADANTTANYSTDGASKPNTLVDGVLSFTGSTEYDLTDGRELESILGTLTDAGAGTFSIAVANALPSYSFKATSTASENVHCKGLVFSKATISTSRNNKVSVTADWVAQNIIELGTAATPQTPGEKPFVYLDAVITFGGGTSIDLEDFNLVIDRATEARRGVESTAASARRLISVAIPKRLSVTGSVTAIAKKELFESVLGASTLQDFRTVANIVFTLTNATNVVAFTVSALINVVSKDTGAEDDLMLMSFDYLGKDITVAGTYTV